MDLDEWEFIPDDGFLETHDDDGKKIYSRNYVKDSSKRGVFNMNYFKSPSPKPQQFVESTEVQSLPKQLVPLPITFPDDHEVVKEVTTSVPSMIKVENEAPDVVGALEGADQDLVSQVFFKKMKENEFVDMKMDSPRSGHRGNVWPQLEAGTFQFDQENHQAMETVIEKEMVAVKEDDEVITWKQSNESEVNMWKWSLTGIGAICSFGVAAAATVCIIILGSGSKNRKHHNHQKLRIQIYADDKRIKDVVHRASRLNDAMSATRGIPRAHITFGGYYEGL